MPTRPVDVRGFRSDSVVDSAPRSTQTWQERFRDPALTVLLILELCTIFLAVPLAAKGLSVAQAVGDTLVLVVIAIVVMLSAMERHHLDLAGPIGHRRELRD